MCNYLLLVVIIMHKSDLCESWGVHISAAQDDPSPGCTCCTGLTTPATGV